jgi:glycosyltransferase involved in cell wall biosynthesis
MEDLPLISVIVTVYNRKKFLVSALESIYSQNLPQDKFELIVVSNIAKSDLLKDVYPLTKWLFISGECSVGNFLFEGINKSSGKYIAFLDDDDLWDIKKLEHVLRVLKDVPNISFYRGPVGFIDEQGDRISPSKSMKIASRKRKKPKVLKETEKVRRIRYLLDNASDFNLSSMVISKECIIPFLHGLSEITGCTDEFFFWCCIAGKGDLYLDNVPLTFYRIHSQNTSGHGISNSMKLNEIQRQIVSLGMILHLLACFSVYNIRRMLTFLIAQYAQIFLVYRGGSKKLVIRNNIKMFKQFYIYFYSYTLKVILLSIIYIMVNKKLIRFLKSFNI